jgi:hypothetical protein
LRALVALERRAEFGERLAPRGEVQRVADHIGLGFESQGNRP